MIRSGLLQELTVSVARIPFGLASILLLVSPGGELPVGAEVTPASKQDGVAAISAETFLNSLGINIHVAQGYPASNYIEPLRYIGVRNVRDSAAHLAGLLRLHEETGVKVDLLLWCEFGSEMSAALQLASAGGLLSLEGPNEPNNFQIKYNGATGGVKESWLPVAQCQQDLYKTAKSNPVLRPYPVFAVSEGGAEPINLGLQYLTIPAGAGTEMPDGTQYADYANVHNYVSSTKRSLYTDNQAWQAADPTLDDAWDGLYGEYGHTWRSGFKGYSAADLTTLPRVTTETGWDTRANPGGQPVQGKVLVNTYLSQFKRGWSYTFIYELVDGEGGEGEQGLYTAQYVPKLSATYIHNLTTILADKSSGMAPGRLDYSIPNVPATVHDLLLQKGNGAFELVIWGEAVDQSNEIVLNFGAPHKNIKIYDVTATTDPVRTYKDVRSLPLVISDHAMIIEVID